MTMTRPTTEQITHNGQILKDVLGPTVNVMAFGAKGDGVTADNAAFTDAIAHLNSIGGGTLVVPSTPNGYFISYAANIPLASNITIVGSQTRIMLEARPNTSTGDQWVFRGSSVSNVRITGLRFEAASLVPRYNNGDTSFNNEVNAGRADGTDQTTLRYPIEFLRECDRITVDHCSFGYGISTAITIRKAPSTSNITNVKLMSLDFDGVSANGLLCSGVDGAIITDITSRNSHRCKFDHLFYVGSECSNFMFDNIYVNTTKGGVFHLYSSGIGTRNNIQISNTTVRDSTYAVLMVYDVADLEVNGLDINGCDVALSLVSGSNIRISGLNIANSADAAIYLGFGGAISDVTIQDFTIVGPGVAMVVFGVDRARISRGTILNCGAAGSGKTLTTPVSGSALPASVVVEDVSFWWTSFVPTVEQIDIRYAVKNIEFNRCNFICTAGTATVKPVFYTIDATVRLSDCRVAGWSRTGNANLISTQFVHRIADEGAYVETLTANSATPSVAGMRFAVTANTSATAITNLTGGTYGQEVWIRVADANTTFDFSSSSLKGNNGVDYTATSGDMVHAKLIGTLWYCTVIEA